MQPNTLTVFTILTWILATADATNPGVVIRVNNNGLEYGKLSIEYHIIIWKLSRFPATLSGVHWLRRVFLYYHDKFWYYVDKYGYTLVSAVYFPQLSLSLTIYPLAMVSLRRKAVTIYIAPVNTAEQLMEKQNFLWTIKFLKLINEECSRRLEEHKHLFDCWCISRVFQNKNSKNFGLCRWMFRQCSHKGVPIRKWAL